MRKVMLFILATSMIFCMPSFGEDVQGFCKEVDTTFKLNGKPIHPKLIQEFEPWLSDGSPVTISVDVLAAYGTNEYFEGDIKLEEDRVTYGAEDHATFTYKWLGRLQNGLHVLIASDWGGGSGIFMNLLFVKFEISKGVDGYLDSDEALKPYDRILMTVVCNYALEDRYDGEIKLQAQENKVIVQKGNSRKILDFNNVGL